MKVTKPVVDKLFYRLREIYGATWVVSLRDAPIAEIKAEWLKRLDKYTAETVGKVLEDIKLLSKDAPTLDQFDKFMSDRKNFKSGHLSNAFWEEPELEKCSDICAGNHLKKIRGLI